MNHSTDFSRSQLLMSTRDTAMLIVDVQVRLLSVMQNSEGLIWNLSRLARGAQALGVPILGTEQYPEKLGATVSPLADAFESADAKLTFSCCGCNEFVERLQKLAVQKVLVCGIETHVCVLQTVMDLLTAGYEVFVPVDAVLSRFDVDRETALKRMEASGVTLTTVETALFEWCEKAGTPEFKQISQLVRETAPTSKSC